jgi:GMP synthase-like glutamine amidotransferase
MILVVYFDEFFKNLVKRLKENNVDFEIVKYDNLENFLLSNSKHFDKVIITGSKKRIMREHDFPLLETFMKQNIKIIGICFGFQYLAYKTGGKLVECEKFVGIRNTEAGEHIYFNHYDRIIDLPKKWKIIAKIDGFINIAATEKWIGFQFHPEKNAKNFIHYILPFLLS